LNKGIIFFKNAIVWIYKSIAAGLAAWAIFAAGI